MQKTKKSEIMRQWLYPFLLLLVLLCGVLFQFSIRGHSKSELLVKSKLEEKGETYAAQLQQEVANMTQTGLPVADMIGKYSEEEWKLRISSMAAICKHSKAYQVIYADSSGKGMDQRGRKVNILEEPYFSPDCIETTYAYVAEDNVRSRSAVVAILPIRGSGTGKYTLYLFYPIEDFFERFDTLLHTEGVFYGVALGNTRIAKSVSKKEPYSDEKALRTFLFEGSEGEQRAEKVAYRIAQNKTDSIVISGETGQVNFIYTPVHIMDWYFFMGMDQKKVDLLVKQDWKETKAMINQILILVFVFGILLILMGIINKLRYKKQSKTLEEKADTDLLTGLYNKMATEREIETYMKENPEKEGIFFLIDIDNFKKINDTQGHAFGDEVLYTLGIRLKVEFRKSDIIGRIGGDEMVVFLKDVPKEAMMREIQRLEKFYQGIEVGQYVKYAVTASIGAAIYPVQGKTFKELYEAADRELYKAKKNGKNCLVWEKELL